MKQKILRLVILFLLFAPVLAFATSPTVSPSDRLPEAHATSASRRVTTNEAIGNSLNMACEQWKSDTMEGQATAIHIWRDAVSHGGSYFPDPANTWDYVAHIVRYDLLPGGSFDSVIGARIRSPKP